MPADRLEESRFLDTVRVEATDIHPPSGIRAAVLEGRNRIPITLHRLVERRLPVRIEMGADERVSDIVLEPETVLVRGPQEILERIRSIPIQLGALPAKSSDTGTTEPIHVEGVPLPQELEGRKVRFSPVAISASMKIQPRQKIHEFAQVPIQFLCPPGFTLRPLFSDERAGKISLRLLGPSGAEAPIITAYVDLSGKKWEPGLYEEPVRLQLPKDFQLTQGPLRPVAFQLVGPDATPRATGAISGP